MRKKKSASKKRSQNVRSVKNHIEFWPYIFCSICWCTLCFHKLCMEIEENWLGCDGCASLHGFNKRLYRAPSQSWFWRLELSGILQRKTYCENLKSLDVTFPVLTESLDLSTLHQTCSLVRHCKGKWSKNMRAWAHYLSRKTELPESVEAQGNSWWTTRSNM